MSNAQVERALSYLLSAKQTKRHFSSQPDDENNRKLKKHQLTMLKLLFESFSEDVRILAKEKYDQL